MLAFCSCAAEDKTESPTEVVVVVSEMAASMDGFTTRVRSAAGAIVSARSFLVSPGAVVLPADFGVIPAGGHAGTTFTVELDAMSGGATRFTTRALTGFVEGDVRNLVLVLDGRCLDEAATCREDETCRSEGCVPASIDPDDLPPAEVETTSIVEGSLGFVVEVP